MKRTIGVVLCVVIAIGCCVVYALFRGHFDHSTFKVEEIQQSPTKEIAAIVKHSDNQALNGDEYFLLIQKDAPSPEGAKSAYYNKEAIFGTNQDCLTIQWLDSSKLKVSCNGHSIGPDQIDVMKQTAGDVQIVYENISPK